MTKMWWVKCAAKKTDPFARHTGSISLIVYQCEPSGLAPGVCPGASPEGSQLRRNGELNLRYLADEIIPAQHQLWTGILLEQIA